MSEPRTTLARWLDQWRDGDEAAERLFELPLVERAALLGIVLNITDLYGDGSPGDYPVFYVENVDPYAEALRG